MRIPKKPFKLRITKADAKKAHWYVSNHHCIVCQAFKRRGFTGVHASDAIVSTSQGKFEMNTEDANKVLDAYKQEGWSPVRSDFKPFTVTLSPL